MRCLKGSVLQFLQCVFLNHHFPKKILSNYQGEGGVGEDGPHIHQGEGGTGEFCPHKGCGKFCTGEDGHKNYQGDDGVDIDGSYQNHGDGKYRNTCFIYNL